jgi:hypothetical protein
MFSGVTGQTSGNNIGLGGGSNLNIAGLRAGDNASGNVNRRTGATNIQRQRGVDGAFPSHTHTRKLNKCMFTGFFTQTDNANINPSQGNFGGTRKTCILGSICGTRNTGFDASSLFQNGRK